MPFWGGVLCVLIYLFYREFVKTRSKAKAFVFAFALVVGGATLSLSLAAVLISARG